MPHKHPSHLTPNMTCVWVSPAPTGGWSPSQPSQEWGGEASPLYLSRWALHLGTRHSVLQMVPGDNPGSPFHAPQCHTYTHAHTHTYTLGQESSGHKLLPLPWAPGVGASGVPLGPAPSLPRRPVQVWLPRPCLWPHKQGLGRAAWDPGRLLPPGPLTLMVG